MGWKTVACGATGAAIGSIALILGPVGVVGTVVGGAAGAGIGHLAEKFTVSYLKTRQAVKNLF